MSGILHQSPAKIIRQLLVDVGIFEEVPTGTADNPDWTAYVNGHPDSPDNSACLYNTTAITHGREHVNGETQKHYGLQIRVRGTDADAGYTKAREVVELFDSVLRQSVTIDGSTYLVQAIHTLGDVLDIGYDGVSKRRLFTINAKTDIRLLTSVSGDFYSPDFDDEDFTS